MPKPSLGLLLPTQGLGAFAEILGQREVRIVHSGSIARALAAISIYSCVEAIVVLGFCQIAFPDVTEQQVTSFMSLF